MVRSVGHWIRGRWGQPRDLLIAAIITIGIALRSIQYFANRSLYTDEAALGLNLRNRRFLELFDGPFDFAQTAPAAYLIVQKAILSLLGSSEYLLRLVPFTAGVFALVAFSRLARKVLPAGAFLIVLFIFATAFPLIYFSADAKQYSVDVLSSVLVLMLASRYEHRAIDGGAILPLSVAGGILVFFSHTAVFALAAWILLIVLRSRARGERLRYVLILGFIWFFSAMTSIATSTALLPEPDRLYMLDFWASGFWPVIPRTVADAFWIPRTGVRLGVNVLGSFVPALLMAAFLAGAVQAIREKSFLVLLSLLTITLVFVASAVGRYPIGSVDTALAERTVLFLAPHLLLLIGHGLGVAFKLLSSPARLGVALLVTGSNVALLSVNFPIQREEIRPVLESISETRQTGDAIYVYYGARHGFDWYAPSLNLYDTTVIYGECARPDPRLYADDVRSIAATGRVWLVISRGIGEEPQLLRSLFRQGGTEVTTIVRPGASAHLFTSFDASAVSTARNIEVAPFVASVGCRGVYDWSATHTTEGNG